MNRYFYSAVIFNFVFFQIHSAEKLILNFKADIETTFDFSAPKKYSVTDSMEKSKTGGIKFTFICQEIDSQLPEQRIIIETDKSLKPLNPILKNSDTYTDQTFFNELESIAIAAHNGTTLEVTLLDLKKNCSATALRNFINYAQAAGKGQCNHLGQALYLASYNYDLFSSLHEVYATVKDDFLHAQKQRTICVPFPFEKLTQKFKSAEGSLIKINVFAALIAQNLCPSFFIKVIDKKGEIYTFPQKELVGKLLIDTLKEKLPAKEQFKRQNAICAYFKSLETV